MKITPSPLVSQMRGRGAGAVCALWRGQQYARGYNPKPANPQSAGQELVRASMSHLVNIWKHAPARFRAAWDTFAEGQKFSGFNAFVSANLFLQKTDTWTKMLPSNPRVFPVTEVAMSAEDAEGGTLSWSVADATPTDKVGIYCWLDVHPITVDAVDEAESLVELTDEDTTAASVETFDVAGLAASTDYVIGLSVYNAALTEQSIAALVQFTTTA